MIECAIFYALIDYLGFGWVQDEQHNAPLSYRIFQVVACWIPIMLYLDNWHDRIGFFILWWTFTADWFYYVFTLQPYMDKLAHVLRMSYGVPKVGWDNWNDTLSDFGNGITHAYWTPVGIAMGVDKIKAIPIVVLIFQSLIGIYLTFLT
jgi:hypothetical protein